MSAPAGHAAPPPVAVSSGSSPARPRSERFSSDPDASETGRPRSERSDPASIRIRSASGAPPAPDIGWPRSEYLAAVTVSPDIGLHGAEVSPATPPSTGPAVGPHTDRPGGQPVDGPTRRPAFDILPRQGPQVPVQFGVYGHNVDRCPVTVLDPEAIPFWPDTAAIDSMSEFVLPVDMVDDIIAASSSESIQSARRLPRPPPCPCHGLPAGSCPAVIDQYVNLVVAVSSHPSGKCNMDGARIPLPRRNIDPAPWDSALAGYFDRSELVRALTFGWDLSFTEPPRPKDAPANLPSAYEHMDAVDEYLATELAFSTLIGPLPSNLPFPVYWSPLGVVPKPPAGWRTITDCSQRGEGVNQFIPVDTHRGKPAKITLPGTAQICHGIKTVRLRYPGEVVELFKGDFGRYYRQLMVCPSQSPFLAVGWRGQLYADQAWSFGNRGACGGAQRFSSAVSWFFRTKVPPAPGRVNSGINCSCETHCGCGDNCMFVYVDDSIGVVPRCHAVFLFSTFIELVDRLGLLLSATPGHVTPPSSVVVALGLQYDTEANTVSLPLAKLTAVRALLREWLVKTSASPQSLASLAGKLLWCVNAVQPGRVFLGRVLATKRWADHLGHPVALDAEFKKDIVWWNRHISAWNGRSFLLPVNTADVAIDASSSGWTDGGPGLGGFCFANNQYFINNGRSRDPRRLHLARTLVGLQFSGNYRLQSA